MACLIFRLCVNPAIMPKIKTFAPERFYLVKAGRRVGFTGCEREFASSVNGFPGKVDFETFDSRKKVEMRAKQLGLRAMNEPEDLKTATTSQQAISSAEMIKILHDNNNIMIPDYQKTALVTKLQVYTDGACKNNGKPDAKAAIGVFWGDDDERNCSERLTIPGKQTNNRAELYAIIKAIQIFKSGKYHKDLEFEILTDSDYSINSLTNWCKKWQLNNWKLPNGNDIENRDLIIEGVKLVNETNAKLVKVKGHNGVYGNEMADKLACSAI